MPYDITIKKVALAGASGTVGSAILKELLKSDLFEVTVLTRNSSHHKFPAAVKIAKVDYTDLESLRAALAGQDALVSAVGKAAVPSQRLLIDAAVEAGVKRIIPSEYGANLKNPQSRALPVFANTVHIEEYLDELAMKGSTSYTLIYTGMFIDLALRGGMLMNFKERKAEIYDGGDQLISTSRVATAGKAVRRVLTHPRETADRAIFVKDIDITQNELLGLAQQLTPGENWEVNQVSTADLAKESLEEIHKKEVTPKTMLGFLKRAMFAPGYGNHFEHVHNSILGIREMTGPDLEELAASIFGTGNLE